MQQTTPALRGPFIRLRTERFDERAGELGLATDAAVAEYIGVNRSALCRIRSGEHRPGERFIAACLSSKFTNSFEWLFELGDAP